MGTTIQQNHCTGRTNPSTRRESFSALAKRFPVDRHPQDGWDPGDTEG